MAEIVIGRSEIPPEGRKIIESGGRSIGVYHLDGEYYAIRNYCPHMGAPLCRGEVGGTFAPSAPREWIYDSSTNYVSCPWHHWQFELETGRAAFDPRVRVRTYRVEVDGDELRIDLSSPRN